MTRQFSFKPILSIAAVTVLGFASSSPVWAQYTTDRYRNMDENNDGVISRSEWRGSDQSFRRHDWNNDGVLSGDELRAGARQRDAYYDDDNRWQSQPNDWTPEAFRRLDTNGDGRISRREWRYDDDAFRRIDRNNDGFIEQWEYIGEDASAFDPAARFDEMDVNHDGRVTRREWTGSSETFEWLDRNNDGVLSRYEVTGGNNVVDTRAYRAGEERGLADGRKAGREDKTRANRWDLDGQRELEHADAGYRSDFGPREEYQAGYRDGFIRGYREGFGPR